MGKQNILEKLILGTWKIGDIESKNIEEIDAIQYAIDKGINSIDTAEMYGDGKSESLIGEAIKDYDRNKLFLISKVLPGNANRNSMYRSVERSLKNLKTDYLDLYLLHWIGFNTDLKEVVLLMEDLKRQKIIKNWGVSNFDTEDMKKLFSIENGNNCIANQVLYNIVSRGIEFDLLPYHREIGINTMAYCPMAHGMELDDRISENKILIDISSKYGITIPQLMLNFVLEKEAVSAVAKSTTKRHLDEMMEAKKIKIDKEDFDLIDKEFPSPKTKEPLETV